MSLDRQQLYEKIDLRVEEMFEQGLLQEVKTLLSFVAESAQSLQAIGYKEVLSYFKGELTLEECKELIKRHTRNYAKRQITFLKRMNPIWLDASIPVEHNAEKILNYIEN